MFTRIWGSLTDPWKKDLLRVMEGTPEMTARPGDWWLSLEEYLLVISYTFVCCYSSLGLLTVKKSRLLKQTYFYLFINLFSTKCNNLPALRYSMKEMVFHKKCQDFLGEKAPFSFVLEFTTTFLLLQLISHHPIGGGWAYALCFCLFRSVSHLTSNNLMQVKAGKIIGQFLS